LYKGLFLIFEATKMQKSPDWGEKKIKSHVVIFKLTMSSYWLPEPGRIIFLKIYFTVWHIAKFGSFLLSIIPCPHTWQNWLKLIKLLFLLLKKNPPSHMYTMSELDHGFFQFCGVATGDHPQEELTKF
jgi:hypothetical protein